MANGAIVPVERRASPQTQINNALIAVESAAVFGWKKSTDSGLTIGLYGGLTTFAGTDTVNADTTKLLVASSTNYVECTVATPPVISVNQSAFTAGRQRLHKFVTNTTGVTSHTDYRIFLPEFVPGKQFADNETPSGTVNGSNATFTLARSPSPAASLKLFNNQLLQRYGVDYTLSGATITFIPAAIPQSDFGSPAAIDILSAYYRY